MKVFVAATVMWVLFWAFWVATNIHSPIWVLAVGVLLAAGFLVVLWRPALRARR